MATGAAGEGEGAADGKYGAATYNQSHTLFVFFSYTCLGAQTFITCSVVILYADWSTAIFDIFLQNKMQENKIR